MTAVRDYLALCKLGITRMCLVTTAGGFLLAPGELSWSRAAATLAGVGLAVSGANAFNMWWERDRDRFMQRTRDRPLPAGRMPPASALAFALTLSITALVLLALTVSSLVAGLTAFAIGSYVLVYTPLKTRTAAALWVGAIPGAMPPLIGWAAAADTLAAPAWVLFAIMWLWQLPHFLAIALFRKGEYARAGICVVPLVRGDAIAKIEAVAFATLLVPVSLLLVPMGLAGELYSAVAAILGAAFLGFSFSGLDHAAGPGWARAYFVASLVYLPMLTIALVSDVALSAANATDRLPVPSGPEPVFTAHPGPANR